MADATEFLHHLSARRHALFNLAVVVGGLGALAGVTFLLPGARESRWWVWGLIVVGGLTAAFTAVVFVPLAVRGGVYRVAVENGWLRVESPHWVFGRSFEVPLSEVARLVVRTNQDGPDLHEVHTRGGERFGLDNTYSGRRHLPADELFAAIHRARPDVPIVTEG